MRIVGTLYEESKAKGGVELKADYWELIGPSSSDLENKLNKVRQCGKAFPHSAYESETERASLMCFVSVCCV